MIENIRRILVVSRISEFNKKGVQYGISLARKYGAKLYVTHVVHNNPDAEESSRSMPSSQKDYENLLKRERRELDDIIAYERKIGMDIDVSIKEGEPTEEILSIIRDESIDLMILLAHEEGHPEHFLFARSNEDLIRTMPCSILLVKKEPHAVPGPWED